MSPPLPTRLFAGATIPDTPLISRALAYTRLHSSDIAFNHIQRSWLFGFIIADKIPALAERDREVHSVAAIMHDLGWEYDIYIFVFLSGLGTVN